MRKLHVVFLLLFCFFLTEGIGQKCKYSKKSRKQAQKHLESEKIVKATKFEALFKDLNKGVGVHFTRSDDDYFLGLTMMRDFSRKMGVTVENPMIFTLQNDSLITVYPNISSVDRGKLGFTTITGTKILKIYYKLSAEQLHLFTAIPIKNIKLYVTLQNKAKKGDTNALDILDFEIRKEKWRSNFMELAQCIYQ